MIVTRRKHVDDSALVPFIGDPLLRQILADRGVQTPHDLDTELQGLLRPTLKDIDKAAAIIATAIMEQQHILIAGDYDVDGMTGTALGLRCLKAFGHDPDRAHFYVPSRYEHGYGLNTDVINKFQQEQVTLVITVDNGITAHEAVAAAHEAGMKVVITDHHEVQNTIPAAEAVVDPKRPDDDFASKNLCGVGVLFYVMSKVRSTLVEHGYYPDFSHAPSMGQFLDLVAVGTIGDVMALDNNNRRIVKAGLNLMRQGRCCVGLVALMMHTKIDSNKVNTIDLGFKICPRFNAATRIKIATNPAIDLLLCDDLNQAMQLATQLDLCNRRRLDHEQVMLARANELYDDLAARFAATAASAPIATAAIPAAVAGLLGTGDSMMSSSVPSAETGAMAADDLAQEGLAELVPAGLSTSNLMEQEQEQGQVTSDKTPQLAGVVLFDPCFMSGLVGLVANRLKERLHKPCFIFSGDMGVGIDGGLQVMLGVNSTQELEALKLQNHGMGPEPVHEYNTFSEALRAQLQHLDPETHIVGSGRSVEGLDLMEVFAYIKSKAPDIIVAGGGHAVAAGATIKLKDLPQFTQLFNEGCAQCNHEEQVVGAMTDGALPDTHLCLAFARDLEQLGPWGKEFEEPTFDGEFHIDSCNIVGNRHLRLKLRTARQHVVEAIKFWASVQEKAILPDTNVRVIYKLAVDRYNNNERLQLVVDALEPI